MRWVALLVAVLAGCSTSQRYAVRRDDMECARATRVVRRTLMTLGYTITRMVEPSAANTGVVAGRRTLPDGRTEAGSVEIRCRGGTVEVQPVEERLVGSDFGFSRAFRYSFISLSQRPDVETPRAQEGLQLLVELVDPFAQRLDLGSEATREGAVLVRVTVRNGTDRAVALSPDSVTLVDAAGTARAPVAEGAVGGMLVPGPGAERVRGELLRRLQVPPRQTAWRLAVYPAGAYGEARVGVEDTETGETEGFVVPVE